MNYPESDRDQFKIDIINFRPNFVIDTKEAYSEDQYVEMRLGQCFFRNIGPTFRCNDIRTDFEKKAKIPEHEPNKTLTKYRTVPTLGIAFGMYYVMEIIENSSLYNEILS